MAVSPAKKADPRANSFQSVTLAVDGLQIGFGIAVARNGFGCIAASNSVTSSGDK